MTIIVTGGSGFLGAAVARSLARRGYRVVAIDVVPGRVVDNATYGLDATVEYVLADVCDVEALRTIFDSRDVCSVVHTVAIAGVDAVRNDLVGSTMTTVGGTAAVLSVSRDSGVNRIIDLSSEEVYGDATGEAIAETARLAPVSTYGAQKAASELLGRTIDGVQYVAARLSWVYGRGFPRARPPQPWLDDAMRGRQSPATAGADHVADLIHVDDAVAAIVALVEAKALKHDAYNVGSGVGSSLGHVADEIRRLSPSWATQPAPGTLPGIAQRAPLAVQRIREELAWQPALSLEEGLRRTLHGR